MCRKLIVSTAGAAYDVNPDWNIMLRSTAAFAFCILCLGMTPLRPAQDKTNKNKEASEGKTIFLVARPELREPIFKESVVLRLPSSVGAGGGLVVGLILNKPARIALSDIFPDDQAFENRSETAYFGGPVDPRAPGVVFRSSKADKQATLLFGDVYVSFDPDFIKELLKEPKKTPDLRLFVGRSQWAPAQLQNEMAMGAWLSVRAETNLIFSATTQYLWRKLIDRADPGPVAKVADVHVAMSQLGLDAKSKACAFSIYDGQQRLIESSPRMGD
jgi:putative AlgH/UPF0301 family transcriptional regulator